MIPEEFKLEENANERELFEKQWGVTIALQSLPLYLNPSETRTIRVAYTPFSTSTSSGFLYIRQVNNEKKKRYNTDCIDACFTGFSEII